ncbi:MAG: hypothetical protein LBI90_03585 [Treponema sp.]|nr:hypothetical protein [Treponema sp.]
MSDKETGITFVFLILMYAGCSTETIIKDYYVRPIYHPMLTGNNWGEEQEIFIDFTKVKGAFFADGQMIIHTKKPHRVIHLKELYFILDGRKCYFVKNAKRKISNEGKTLDGYFFAICDDIKINYDSVFKDSLNDGDEIEIDLIHIYSFDGKNDKKTVLKYKVDCFERKRGLPWFLDPQNLIPY